MKIQTYLPIILAINIFSLSAKAGEIWDVQGKKVVIEFDEGDSIRLHQRYIITHPETNKAMGVVEIIKKKGTKALGKIIRGYARTGGFTTPMQENNDAIDDLSADTVADSDVTDLTSESDPLLEEALSRPLKPKKSRRSPSSLSDERPKNPFYDSPEGMESTALSRHAPGHWGFGLGVTPTNIDVTTETKVNHLKGTNFVIRVAYDKPLKKAFSVLMGASYLPLAGTQPDTDLGLAKVDANYYSFDINGRVSIFGTPLQGPWIGGGLNYLRASATATSNVIAPQSMSSRTPFQINVGYNSRMDSEYLMFRGDMLIHPQASSGTYNIKITQYVFSAIYFF